MAQYDDVATLRVEIANLKFAASSLKEAANVMQAQRDEARWEARRLRHRIRIATWAMMLTVLLVGAVAYGAAEWRTDDDDDEAVTYVGSILASGENTEEGEENEAAELGRLQQLARIDRAAAERASLQAVPGTVHSTWSTDEGGYVIYQVVVAGDDGRAHEVTVDAGNARILQRVIAEQAE